MKSQLKILVSDKITELEEQREFLLADAAMYYDSCDISDKCTESKVAFYGLNLTKNEIRKVESKLKKLRQLQVNLKKTQFFN